MLFFLIVALIICAVIGYWTACWRITGKCDAHGKFTAFGTEYLVLHSIGPDGETYTFCPPFADGVLDKIKSLPKADGVSKSFSLNGEVKEYDCAQCCRDAGDIKRTMIVCRKCGNKRCPKAQDHRMTCTGRNDVGQVGVLDRSAESDVYTRNVSGNPLLHAALYGDASKSEQSVHIGAGCQTNEHYSRSADTGHSSSGCFDSSSSTGGGSGSYGSE
ncbi:hypothetical protein [Acinetobacter sp. ANC 3813]|uniref:hypothetical protein n=1 Tax=Acinetobacter sp. ANC 3813 TaxID=1977873 RepID=UPI000A35A2D1|nr:hypothetical protein [Acinetobacter sp. ANC 3813]OTG87916.1 hypothetical protein B9T34_16415 [Acinetobacter sp. ANC 3813]